MIGIISIEMPENCSDCPIEAHEETFDGQEFLFWCPMKYKGYTEEFRNVKRADWCPIEPMDNAESEDET